MRHKPRSSLYMKVGQKENVRAMLNEAKTFVSLFDEIVSNLTEQEIKIYREKLVQEQ